MFPSWQPLPVRYNQAKESSVEFFLLSLNWNCFLLFTFYLLRVLSILILVCQNWRPPQRTFFNDASCADKNIYCLLIFHLLLFTPASFVILNLLCWQNLFVSRSCSGGHIRDLIYPTALSSWSDNNPFLRGRAVVKKATNIWGKKKEYKLKSTVFKETLVNKVLLKECNFSLVIIYSPFPKISESLGIQSEISIFNHFKRDFELHLHFLNEVQAIINIINCQQCICYGYIPTPNIYEAAFPSDKPVYM